MIRPFSILAALSFAAVAGAASAQSFDVKTLYSTNPSVVTRQTSVKIGLDDLATPSAARALLSQIQRAAIAVCGGMPEATDAEDEKASFAKCSATAVRHGVAKTRSAVLTAALADSRETLLASQ